MAALNKIREGGFLVYSLNPYIIVAIYGYIVFTTGCIYWGWTGIQELLYKAGSYEDACVGESDIGTIVIGGVNYLDCGARKSGINNLFTIAYSIHFMFSFFGGFMLDKLGPKFCFLIGHLMSAIAWLMIFCISNSQLALIFGFIIVGLFIEASYTPLIITLCDLFPRGNSTIISIMGALRSLSYLTPTLLSMIFQTSLFKPGSLYILGIVYVLLGNVTAFLFGIFLVPRKRKLDVEPQSTNKSTGNLLDRFKMAVMIGVKHRQLFEFVALTVGGCLFSAAIELLNKGQREFLVTTDGETAVEVFKYCNILTFVPGPFLGYVMDRVGPAIVLHGLHISLFFYYIFVAIDSYTTKVMACFMYLIAGSLCISSIYCYINERFSKRYFGLFSSIVFCFFGLFSLLNIPIYNAALANLSTGSSVDFRPLAIGLMMYVLVAAILSGFLIYVSKVKMPNVTLNLNA